MYVCLSVCFQLGVCVCVIGSSTVFPMILDCFVTDLYNVGVMHIHMQMQERYVPGSLERIEQSLKWLKLRFDEGPTVGGNYGPYQQVHPSQEYTQIVG